MLVDGVEGGAGRGAAVLGILAEGDGVLDAVGDHAIQRILGQRGRVTEANVVLVRTSLRAHLVQLLAKQ